MKAFKKYFDYVSLKHYTPIYAVATTKKTTIIITERDIQDYTIEQSKIQNIHHISFFMIKKIEKTKNKISIVIDTRKSKKGYFSESDNENETFIYEFETNDAKNFIIYLNRALYRLLTAEELKSINIDQCKEFVNTFPTSSPLLSNDGLINENSTDNSETPYAIKPFYIYARFIEKVLIENSNYFTESIESIVNEVSLKNLRKIIKYKINKINIFRDFPDCQKYFQILLLDIIPLLPNVTNIIFDAPNDDQNNTENNIHSLIQLIEKAKNIKEVTFVGELPSNIENFFTKLCQKKELSLTTLKFKYSILTKKKLSILKTSFISCLRFQNSKFDSNQTFLDFIQTKKLDLLSMNNSPQIDFLSKLKRFTNITVLSLCKCNIEISDFVTFLSKESLNENRIQYLYLSGNQCEKQISNDLKIPKFEEIRLDHITWNDNFLPLFQLLIKTQKFIDLSNSTMNENEWNKVFNYLNTTSEGTSQLCELLWNGNQVNKSFFSYLRKCKNSIDSLQIIDVIDHSTQKEIFDEFTSFLKEGNKLINLFIGFSKQSSRLLSGNQLKSILSSLLTNMKTENLKKFYFYVENSSSGDDGVDALISAFDNLKACRINFINFDGLKPQNPKKYSELCSSISKYLTKSGLKDSSLYEIQYPKKDFKSLKSQMQLKDYKRLCKDFCFISNSSKLSYFSSDFTFTRMVLSPCLEKKKIIETKEHESIVFDLSSLPNEFTDSLRDGKNEKSEKSDTKTEKNLSENADVDDDDEYLDKILNSSDISKSNRVKNSIANNKSNDDDEFKLNLSDDVIEVEKFDEELIRISKNESNKDIIDNNQNENSNSSKQKNRKNEKEESSSNKNKNNIKLTNKNDNENSITTNSHKEESSSKHKISKSQSLKENEIEIKSNIKEKSITTKNKASNTSNKNIKNNESNSQIKNNDDDSKKSISESNKSDNSHSRKRSKNLSSKATNTNEEIENSNDHQFIIDFEEEEEEDIFVDDFSSIKKPKDSLNTSKGSKKQLQYRNSNNFNDDDDDDDDDYDIINIGQNSMKFREDDQSPFKNNFTPKRNLNRSQSPSQNHDDSMLNKRRSHRRNQAEEGSSLMSVPLSSITSRSFEYDDGHRKRHHRSNKINQDDDYYQSDDGHSESNSDSFTLTNNSNLSQLTNNIQNFTPNRKNRKIVPQTVIVERTRKVDLLKGVVPQTVQHSRRRHHRRHRYHSEKLTFDDQELNDSYRRVHRRRTETKRSSSPSKRKSSSFEIIEDRGSDIEFPEMEEITVKHQKKLWNSIEERFSLSNIIQDIRSNK